MIEVRVQVSKGWQGFKYFWALRVDGFDPTNHCQPCFIGERLLQVRLPLAAGGVAKIRARPGAKIYICGVADPYRWKNNFHLPVVAREGSEAAGTLYTGADVEVFNGEELPIDASAAKERYPTLGEEFLTCRNFQFGAQYFRPSAQKAHPRLAAAIRPARKK